MEAERYETWQALHLRTAKGEALTPLEQADYQAGLAELEAGEILDGDLAQMKILREKIARSEAEYQRLAERKQRMNAQIVTLEAQLSERDRQALGIRG